MDARNPVQEVVETEPTVSQLARAEKLRRFNRLYIYTPIVIASVVALAVVLFLLYVALIQPSIKGLETISAIADAAVILGAIPPLVIGGVLLALILAIAVQARRRDIAPLRESQLFLWRVDRFATYLGRASGDLALKIATPFIWARAWAAYVRTFASQLKNMLKRS
jgi:hypothetical protein